MQKLLYIVVGVLLLCYPVALFALGESPSSDYSTQVNIGFQYNEAEEPAIGAINVGVPWDERELREGNYRVLEFMPEDKAERVIYQYIVDRYQKVNPEDAQIIAKSVVKYSREHEVDPFLVTALIERESSFKKTAVSIHGAKGLGQIMPFNFNHLKINDPFDIEQNINGTVQYFKRLMTRWAGNDNQVELAIASYAEGPNAIQRSDGRWKDKTGGYINDILHSFRTFTRRIIPSQSQTADKGNEPSS